MLYVYLSPSHFSHYLLMLWRGRRYYDDRRPKIVSARSPPAFSAALFSSLTSQLTSPPRQCSAVLLTLLWDAIRRGAFYLLFSFALPFSSLHPLSRRKDCIQIRFIGSLCFHGNISKPWQLFEPSQTLFQNCCIHPPLSLPLRASSQPVNAYACDCGYK